MKELRSCVLRKVMLASSCLFGCGLLAGVAQAGGVSGGQVKSGSATITYGNNSTTITQSSKKAFINWNSFSIPSDASVTFQQPNKGSLTVNRVTGPEASQIYGDLLANGRIWLINSNGILFGKGSQIDVGALIATTSDITDDDWRNGRSRFAVASKNPNASVVNQGTIKAAPGGSVVLSAPRVANEGVIQADLGTVQLGSANAFTVDLHGDNLIRYQVTAPVSTAPKDANGSPAAALVSNSGTIIANGGKVLMTARAAQSVQDSVINNTGMVEATSVSQHDGEIVLDAGDGTVNAGGVLDASGKAAGEKGGSITIAGKTVNVADGAKLDASGDRGGGSIHIGGDLHGGGTMQGAAETNVGKATLVADALTQGNGGKITVWSDKKTVFAGSASAKGGSRGGNGGLIETSGAGTLQVDKAAAVNTLATHGNTGTWLLDPQNIDIVSGGQDGLGGSNIDPGTITDALGSTNVELEAGQNITIDNAVTYTSGNAFSLLAQGNIVANASVQNGGAGAVNLVAGWDGTTTDISLLTNSGVYGNNGGNILIGGGNAGGGVSVGSAGGRTLVEGSDVSLNGVNGYAQVGYYDGSAAGDIVVNATHNIDLTSTGGFTQIGHGGSGASGSNSGNITVNATGDITLASGDTSFGKYAQIGNGGDESNGGESGTQTGDISVTADNVSLKSNEGATQIGHGGSASFADNSGNITLNLSGDLTLAAGGVDTWGYAMVGHGGDSTSGNDTGDIDITTGGAVSVTGGGDFAQIGNGGWGSFGTHQGAITVKATGDVTVAGADVNSFSYGQIGNGGEVSSGDNTGDISVAGNNISLTGGLEYAQIGNGGFGSEGNETGNIALQAAQDVILTGGGSGEEDFSGFALVGNGSEIGNKQGDIDVTAGGNVNLTGGSGTIAFAQIGNGGVATLGSSSGDIAVNATGNVTLDGGAGPNAYAQIGHGGALSNPGSQGYENSGLVTVSGETVVLDGGDGAASYAQIGHGGFLSGAGLVGNGKNSGDISVTAVSEVDLAGGGPDSYAQIGNGGDQSNFGAGPEATGSDDGNISVTVANQQGPLVLTAGDGDHAYAQVGNGGYGSNGQSQAAASAFTVSGNILASDLSLTGSDIGIGAYAQIGNGDASESNVGDVSGDITLVSARSVEQTDGTAEGAAALIGNATGNGTVTGIVTFPEPPTPPIDNPETIGAVTNLIQGTPPTLVVEPPMTFESAVPPPEVLASAQEPASSVGGSSEEQTPSDAVADTVGNSLNGKSKSQVVQMTRTIIPGVLKQVVLFNARQPHGVPPAEQDYSSWGNQTLWW